MTPADFDEFSAIVLGFAELRGRELSSPAIKLFWNAMQDWTLTDFKQAANVLLASSKFMPTPYDFQQLRRAGEQTAHEAWSQVLNGEPPLDPGSRAWRAAQSVGGQYYVRHANLERDVPHIERRFIEAYEQLAEVEPVREALPQIAKPPVHKAMRGPAPIATLLPQLRAPDPIASPPPARALPAPALVGRIPASVRIEKLARSMPTLTDDELARIAGEPVETVRQVRAALEAAA